MSDANVSSDILDTSSAVTQSDFDGINAVRKAMRECEPARQELAAELKPLFEQVWKEALECLETALPDFLTPGTADAKLHRSLRNRILNTGNAKVRELPNLLKNYFLQHVFQRSVTVHAIQTHGIHKLPVGVEMPPRPEVVKAA